jgi:hypothetical protein
MMGVYYMYLAAGKKVGFVEEFFLLKSSYLLTRLIDQQASNEIWQYDVCGILG